MPSSAPPSTHSTARAIAGLSDLGQDPSDESPAKAPAVELSRVGGPGVGLGGVWRVVVLNDDYNAFDHVAETLARVILGTTLARRLPAHRPDPQHGLRDRVERPA